jgi:alkanesulfonate monooxygenase SsuD/methylene tetrahydromethanopterin reductase-like flavin-dependent oxidoreductase (luciferase family)
LDAQLAELRRAWAEPDGFAVAGPAPRTPGGPPILLGGTSPAALRRVSQHGSGWICGLGGAGGFARTADVVRDHWRRAGRDGAPRLLSIVNFALGSQAPEVSASFLRRYYAAAPFVDDMVRDTPTTLDEVRAELDAHRQVGCDEVLLFPCADDLSQLELAAQAL